MSKFIKLTLRESGRTIAIDATRVSKIREFKEGGCVVVGHEVNCEVSQSIDEILAQIGGERAEAEAALLCGLDTVATAPSDISADALQMVAALTLAHHRIRKLKDALKTISTMPYGFKAMSYGVAKNALDEDERIAQ